MIELGAVQGTVPCTTPVGEPLFMYEKSSSWGGTRNRPQYHPVPPSTTPLATCTWQCMDVQ